MLGIFMLRIVQHLPRRTHFDQLAAIHHADAIRDLLDHSQIVADEQHGQAVTMVQSFRATGIGPSCSQKSPVAARYFRQGRGKDPARRRNLMHGLKSAFAACGLALLAAIPAAAEDLTIALGYPRTADPLGRGVTTLFISPNYVRYRTRNYYEGNKDWVFKWPAEGWS
jgi:hypothetical protein